MATQQLDGGRLRAARLRAGLSRPAAAVAAARSTESLALYERGRINPPVHVLSRLASAYGVEVADFFSEEVADASR